MPRPRCIVPKYSHHRSTGRAFVRVDGRFRYLGAYGTAESREAYARFVREYQATGTLAAAAPPLASEPSTPTVAAVLAAFWAHAKTAYPYDPSFDGRRPPGEIGNLYDAMKPVLKLFGSTPAVEFGPKALMMVRSQLVADGLCRNVVNRRVNRVKLFFKWAVSSELLPGETYHRLATVSGLRRGVKGVRETAKVLPVAEDVLNATVAVLSPRIAAMVRVQLYTGMRSGNLCAMRTADVDTTGGKDGAGAWVYRPRSHKTAHLGHDLVIRLGPKAQAALAPYLKPDRPEAFVFSPAEEMAEVRAARTAARVTPLSCGNRVGSKPAKQAPRKKPGDHYTQGSYAAAITRACDRADAVARAAKAQAGEPVADDVRLVARWHPHQLRHNRGTVVRTAHGTDGVLAALGQRTSAMADRYGEIEAAKAERVAIELG